MMNRMMKYLIALSFVLLWVPARATPGFTHVQGATNSASSGTSMSVTLPSNPTAGNLVVCGAATYTTSATTMSSVQDAGGNTYISTPHSPSTWTTDGQAFAFYLKASGTANKTITVTFTSSLVAADLWCDEFAVSGALATFDADAVSNNGGSTAISSPSLTATSTGDLMYSTCAAGQTSSIGSPWTASTGGISANGNGNGYDTAAPSVLATNFTQSSAQPWSCIISGFKLAVPSGFPIIQ